MFEIAKFCWSLSWCSRSWNPLLALLEIANLHCFFLCVNWWLRRLCSRVCELILVIIAKSAASGLQTRLGHGHQPEMITTFDFLCWLQRLCIMQAAISTSRKTTTGSTWPAKPRDGSVAWYHEVLGMISYAFSVWPTFHSPLPVCVINCVWWWISSYFGSGGFGIDGWALSLPMISWVLDIIDGRCMISWIIPCWAKVLWPSIHYLTLVCCQKWQQYTSMAQWIPVSVAQPVQVYRYGGSASIMMRTLIMTGRGKVPEEPASHCASSSRWRLYRPPELKLLNGWQALHLETWPSGSY